MHKVSSRRHFVAHASVLLTGMCCSADTQPDPIPVARHRCRWYKAALLNKPEKERLSQIKAAGFDGLEVSGLQVHEAKKYRVMADSLGLRIHSVLRGWADCNSSDDTRVEAAFNASEDALRAAQVLGADAILLVPGRIGGMRIPSPHEFQIEFDPVTGRLLSVTKGDDAAFEDYIGAHNHAAQMARVFLERLIPLAEKLGVVIALENVWNNLWVQPEFFRHFVASFSSPWVRAYFDIGNHVKYGSPEEWIRVLGRLIIKCHVKDFKLNEDPGGDGAFVNIGEGSVNWMAVCDALDAIDYKGWLTIEGGRCSLIEHGRRLETILLCDQHSYSLPRS